MHNTIKLLSSIISFPAETFLAQVDEASVDVVEVSCSPTRTVTSSAISSVA